MLQELLKVSRAEAASTPQARRLLDGNKERVGQVTTGNPARGQETWVYGRAGRPCRRCRTPVPRVGQGAATEERITFWCPHCQPMSSQASKTAVPPEA